VPDIEVSPPYMVFHGKVGETIRETVRISSRTGRLLVIEKVTSVDESIRSASPSPGSKRLQETMIDRRMASAGTLRGILTLSVRDNKGRSEIVPVTYDSVSR